MTMEARKEHTIPTESINTSTPSSITIHNHISPIRALIAGATAGVSVDVGLFPLDTLKTRLQSPQGFFGAGGFRGVYKGLSAAASGSAPGAALFFVTYETAKPLVHNTILHSEKDLNDNPLTHMISASIGEIGACLVRVPTEVVKQRMQTGKYRSFSFALTRIFQRGGIGGFYTGYLTTVAREIPFSFIQFPIWERLKLLYSRHLNDNEACLPIQGALCGSFAGAIAASVTTPLDVIKTRLMLVKDANGIAYNGFRDCSKRIYAEGGLLAFYRGITPRVCWIFVGGFFFFGAYEQTKALLA